MQLSLALVLVASSITASATGVAPAPAEKVRDISPRQTSNLLESLIDFANSLGVSGCLPQALPLVTELPTIPSGLIGNDLISQAVSQTTLALSDICSFSITGSVGTIFTDFLPSAYSWYSAHHSQIASIVSGCTSAAKLTSTVDAYASCKVAGTTITGGGVSSTGSAAATGTKSQASVETNTSISNTSPLSLASPTTTVSSTTGTAGTASTAPAQNMAPQETGMMMAAAAMAGFIGMIAAL